MGITYPMQSEQLTWAMSLPGSGTGGGNGVGSLVGESRQISPGRAFGIVQISTLAQQGVPNGLYFETLFPDPTHVLAVDVYVHTHR